MKKQIRAAIDAYPKPVAERLAELRELILETARDTNGVGRIEEDLRWGQPSFLTSETGSGSTIRIDGDRRDPSRYAIYFHCRSGLVAEFRRAYDKQLSFAGDRAVVLEVDQPLPRAALKHCIALALTHHLRKKPKKRPAGRS